MRNVYVLQTEDRRKVWFHFFRSTWRVGGLHPSYGNFDAILFTTFSMSSIEQLVSKGSKLTLCEGKLQFVAQIISEIHWLKNNLMCTFSEVLVFLVGRFLTGRGGAAFLRFFLDDFGRDLFFEGREGLSATFGVEGREGLSATFGVEGREGLSAIFGVSSVDDIDARICKRDTSTSFLNGWIIWSWSGSYNNGSSGCRCRG